MEGDYMSKGKGKGKSSGKGKGKGKSNSKGKVKSKGKCKDSSKNKGKGKGTKPDNQDKVLRVWKERTLRARLLVTSKPRQNSERGRRCRSGLIHGKRVCVYDFQCRQR